MGEKENIKSYWCKTIETSKEECNKQLLEQREGTSGSRIKLRRRLIRAIKEKYYSKRIIMQLQGYRRRKEDNDIMFKRRYKGI